jgi:mycofactocin precursor
MRDQHPVSATTEVENTPPRTSVVGDGPGDHELVDREQVSADSLVEQESLVEDISIDGMCGVY